MSSVKILQLTVSISLVCLLACKKDKSEDAPAPDPTPIVTDTCGTPLMTFLTNGHTLVYDFNYFGTTVPLTQTIKSYGNAGEFKTVWKSSVINDSLYSRECGGILYNAPRYPLISTHVFRKSTTNLNDTWTYVDGPVTTNYKVVAKNVNVTVLAGTFTCDKITAKQVGTADTDTIYFNNSIGDVIYIRAGYNYKLKSKNF